MKIELEEPYKSVFKAGYVVVNNQNRKNVILTKVDGGNTTTSYARYQTCVKLGYFLPLELEVDHIDNDKTNDDVSNLQVLNAQQNKEKEHERMRLLTTRTFQCNCGNFFSLRNRDINMKIKAGLKNFYCSRECSVIYKPYVGRKSEIVGS